MVFQHDMFFVTSCHIHLDEKLMTIPWFDVEKHVLFFIKWSSLVQVGWYLVFLGYIAVLPFYVPSPHQWKPWSLMTHGQNVNVLQNSPKTCPPKKHSHPICFFLRPDLDCTFWGVQFHQSLPLEIPNAEVLGDGDMEPWASWPGISEVFWWFGIPGGPSEVWCKPEKSHSAVIDLQWYFIVNCYYLLNPRDVYVRILHRLPVSHLPKWNRVKNSTPRPPLKWCRMATPKGSSLAERLVVSQFPFTKNHPTKSHGSLPWNSRNLSF